MTTNLLVEKHKEGETESDEKNGEHTQHLYQCPQDLQEHDHIDSKEIKPINNKTLNLNLYITKLNSFSFCKSNIHV